MRNTQKRIPLRDLALIFCICTFAGMGSGCATVFTGTHSTVEFESQPQGANLVVMGGTVAKILITGTQASIIVQTFIGLLEPHIEEDTMAILKKADIRELLTAMVLFSRAQEASKKIPPQVSTAVQKIPKPIIKKALSFVGVDNFGVAPAALKLDHGSPYLVMGVLEGYRIEMSEIETSINHLIWLNIFNLGIGALIDLLSGAWLEIDTERLSLEMTPLKPQAN